MNRQYNRGGNGRWTERWYSFVIEFKSLDPKDLNEELKSSTYKSAADKLSKIGHIKRPEELMKWHEITKQKEFDAIKLATINDCKQLGVYQLSVSYRKDGSWFKYEGDFYINLRFDKENLQEYYDEWKQGGGNLWMPFSFGVIPINEDGIKFLKEVYFYLAGDKTTYWLGSFYLNLTQGNEEGDLVFKPAGKGYFEENDGDFYFSNRSSAIRFKDSLFKVFNGDIVLKETSSIPGGEKERILDYLCSDLTHDLSEFEDVMNSIKRINLNSLYKD
jgi:hypothetical protein